MYSKQGDQKALTSQRHIYLVANSLTSKISLELAGIPGRDCLPYARWDGMVILRSPPTAMPGIPMSQPLITSPLPILQEKGFPPLLAVRSVS